MGSIMQHFMNIQFMNICMDIYEVNIIYADSSKSFK